MKNCTHCVHAEWRRTAAGKLHPSGDGACKKKIAIPQLPQAFYWISAPTPKGGSINRRKTLSDHCAYWADK